MSDRPVLRAIVLLAALGGMESAWLAGLVPLLVPSARAWPLLGTVVTVWGSLIVAALAVRKFLPENAATIRRQAALALVPAATYLLLARWLLFPAVPAGDLGWLVDLVKALGDALSPGPAWGLLVVVILAWWRSLNLVEIPDRIADVALRFRVQILLLVAGIVVLTTQVRVSPVLLVWVFFGSSLMALALVRVEEAGDLVGEGNYAFDRQWLTITLMATACIVGLSALLARALSFSALAAVWARISPLARLLGELLFAVLVVVGVAIGQIVLRVMSWLLGGRELRLELQPLQVPEAPEAPPPQAWTFTVPGWVHTLGMVLQYVVVLLAVAVVLLGLTLLVRRERRRRLARQVEFAEVGDAGETVEALRETLNAWWERLRGAFRLLGQYGPTPTFLAALSVHNIYINLLRWAAMQGLPRRPAETPYEHLHRLQRAFPALAEEMARITEAFVAAHYGALQVGGEELERLRAAWARIRAGNAAPDSASAR